MPVARATAKLNRRTSESSARRKPVWLKLGGRMAHSKALLLFKFVERRECAWQRRARLTAVWAPMQDNSKWPRAISWGNSSTS
jgi:hypothetical protein